MLRRKQVLRIVEEDLPRVSLLVVRVGIALLLLGNFTLAFSQAQRRQQPSKTSGASIERGRYIVEGVARCGQCHTPRDNNGAPDRARELQGAPVPFLSAKPESDWPLNAPRIGGTPLPASDADIIKLLTTGIWNSGTFLRSPMPQFRMSHSDAESVVAYLKSVNPEP